MDELGGPGVIMDELKGPGVIMVELGRPRSSVVELKRPWSIEVDPGSVRAPDPTSVEEVDSDETIKAGSCRPY